MPYAKVNDVTLHYNFCRVPGREVLVLSNALGATMDMWWNQQSLQREFSLLRYDARGQGKSSAPEGPYDLKMLGEDVVALMDDLGIERAHFCGVALGGAVGQWLGVNAAERLLRLVLSNTASVFGDGRSWNVHIGKVRRFGLSAVADEIVEQWLTATYRQEYEQEMEVCRRMILSNKDVGYIGSCEALKRADLTEDTARILTETLVIYGNHDRVTPPSDAFFLADTIPNACSMGLGCAHVAAIDSFPFFNRGVETFLKTGSL